MCIELKYIELAADRDSITKVGGEDLFGIWGITTERAVELINSGEWAFFVKSDDTPPKRTEVRTVDNRYLRTLGDTSDRNNLRSLPERSLPTMPRPPVNIPGARIPAFEAILAGSSMAPVLGKENATEIFFGAEPRNTSVHPKAYGILPAISTIVQFTAPWPGELVIRVAERNDTVEEATPLVENKPSSTSDQQQGWYEVLEVNPHRPDPQNPSLFLPPLWRVAVIPPVAMRRSPGYVVMIGHRTSNPNCWGQEKNTLNDYKIQNKIAEKPDPWTGVSYNVPKTTNGKHHPLTMMFRVTRNPNVRRRSLTTLDASERRELCVAIFNNISENMIRNHHGRHHGPNSAFLADHRDFIWDLERLLLEDGFKRFVPLPKWDPSEPIPPEFAGVKQPSSGSRPALENLSPNNPAPPHLRSPKLCDIPDLGTLARRLYPWHSEIHTRQFTRDPNTGNPVPDSGNGGGIGGAMARDETAAAAVIFYPWHAYIDEIVFEWEQCK